MSIVLGAAYRAGMHGAAVAARSVTEPVVKNRQLAKRVVFCHVTCRGKLKYRSGKRRAKQNGKERSGKVYTKEPSYSTCTDGNKGLNTHFVSTWGTKRHQEAVRRALAVRLARNKVPQANHSLYLTG